MARASGLGLGGRRSRAGRRRAFADRPGAELASGAGLTHPVRVIRRTFLRGAVASGATAGLAAGFLGFRSSETLPAPRGPLHVLDATSFGVLAVVAGRVLPFAGTDPVTVAHGVDASLRYATPEAQDDLRLALGVLENGLSGLLTRGSATLFSELDPAAQDAALRRWGDSPLALLRGATDAIRKLCLGQHYARLENAVATGYPGPPLDKPEPPPIAARAPLASDPTRFGQARGAEEGREGAELDGGRR